MNEIVRIPEERINILIGKDGRTRKTIEKRCSVKLKISEEGVEIRGDPENVFFATDVVKAIGRGFEPRKALKLLRDEYALYVIPLRELVSTDKAMTRVKGRVIGENGTVKTRIEEATDSFLSIYGSTISIISKIDTMEYAKEAISMLIEGARHSSVLAYLSKSRREIMDSRLRS